MKPFELPGYEIKDKIGEGGMATVWRARQISLDRPVAIKVLTKQSVPDEEAMKRFRQEAQSAARINHHGIVQVYDAGEKDGLPYFVMEYIEGCSVGDLLERKGKLSEKNALMIAEGVALGLGYAWEKAAIIHCDVKPDNIMVERDGSVKVADLGLARLVGPRTAHDHSGLIIGTPNYASPEQSQGVPDLDCRSDIYSLGAMLYHMVTGVLPFAGSAGSTAMDKHVADHLADPLDLNPELSQGMAWLIEKLMIKDRSLRPQTWVSVLYDLKEVRGGGLPPNLPEPGQSTVLRSDHRLEAAPPRSARETRERETAEAAAGIRRRIVISKDDFEQVRAPSRSGMLNTDRALVGLLLLGLLAFGAYEGVLWFARQRAEEANPAPRTDLPPRATVTNTSVLHESPSQAVPATSAQPAPPPSTVDAAEALEWEGDTSAVEKAATAPTNHPHGAEPIKWDNPAFAEGANLFNAALGAYDAYRKDKTDPTQIQTAEADCRRAINLFESCKPLAPADVDMQALISQCYHLLSDIRHTMLLDPSQAGPIASPAPPPTAPEQPAPAPTPPLTEAPRAAAPATAVPPETAAPKEDTGPGVTLSQIWCSKLTGSDAIWGDINELLTPYGKAELDLAGNPGLTIYGPITYLMPAKDAARALNASLTLSHMIDCPGFPSHSFSYYDIDGSFEGGFGQLLLIVDAADRVVAVQLVNEHPDSLWLAPEHFTDSWHTHNFIQSRAKGNKKWKIAYRVRYMEKVLYVDSELAAYDERAIGQLGKSKERVELILPHQIANLVLYRIEKGR